MATKDPRVDAYIDKAAPFARPILEHLRGLVHKACPNCTETIKWSMPFFEYEGNVLCHMAGFKQHCALGFWKHAGLMKDPQGILHVKDKESMGHLDRITGLEDLPSDKIMVAYIKDAMGVISRGEKPAAPVKKAPKAALPVPPELAAALALKKNKKAATAFEEFPPSHRREYIEWITEAKTEATRDKRIATTIEWLMEGKSRNWKYEKK